MVVLKAKTMVGDSVGQRAGLMDRKWGWLKVAQ
jgi:hypothetical protein